MTRCLEHLRQVKSKITLHLADWYLTEWLRGNGGVKLNNNGAGILHWVSDELYFTASNPVKINLIPYVMVLVGRSLSKVRARVFI